MSQVPTIAPFYDNELTQDYSKDKFSQLYQRGGRLDNNDNLFKKNGKISFWVSF